MLQDSCMQNFSLECFGKHSFLLAIHTFFIIHGDMVSRWKVVTMLSCYKGAACSRSLYTVPSSKTLEIYVKV